jgi:hypothetical protein
MLIFNYVEFVFLEEVEWKKTTVVSDAYSFVHRYQQFSALNMEAVVPP